ncbi:hypothetical protein D7231_31815 [Streptomyces klenkii]|uniref:Tail terminator n=1 Tax=Streptomyces klenkii TaxID=1420899 RepID=A0A3B0AN32_9ACTN|nr:hypothetical protein [Streptomyces klenkii]RKN61861.1 hypothetical protein D7231_31815 [Streptomyces klenkii]
MAIQIRDILNAVVSHAAASGHFEQVNGHEPVNPPGNGLTAAVWTGPVRPVRSSGLATTTGGLVCMVRLYTSALQEPLDAMDPNLIDAIDGLFRAYIADFTLGGLVRQVDIFGAHGPGLTGQDGYLETADQTFRVYTITLPLIVDDLWPQTP